MDPLETGRAGVGAGGRAAEHLSAACEGVYSARNFESLSPCGETVVPQHRTDRLVGASHDEVSTCERITVRVLGTVGDVAFQGTSSHEQVRIRNASAVDAHLGGGDDELDVVSPAVTASLGGGDDEFHMGAVPGTIDLRMGAGRDYADTFAVLPEEPRFFDGGPGVDETQLGGHGNTCVHVEKGTCPT